MTGAPSADDESLQLTLQLDDQPETHIRSETLIYVASALTALEPNELSVLSGRCEIIDRTIVDTTAAAGAPWQVHLPVLWSAPKPDDQRPPREIYQLNRSHVRRASLCRDF